MGLGAALLMFAVAFGAATVLPFQSELLFVAYQAQGTLPLWALLLSASLGNVLGSVVNYVLGAGLERWRGTRWMPLSEASLDRAQDWYNRWGVWTLLLSWAPYGDAFTVVAGVARTPIWLFLALVTLAKTGRYALLALATAGVL